ncbi:MAG: hypothetical protein MJY87_02555 [Fibrobacter sp.]|nr:hypothetical protein [Fibrobacter sp.]
MKKRKTLISRNMAAVCEDLRRQQRELLQMADKDNLQSDACVKYPPCICCGKEGTNVRKCFFPLDYEAQVRSFGWTFSMSLCVDCLNKAIDRDRVFQIVDLKEIGVYVK